MVRSVSFFCLLAGIVIAATRAVKFDLPPVIIVAGALGTLAMIIPLTKGLPLVGAIMYRVVCFEDKRSGVERFLEGFVGGFLGNFEVVAGSMTDNTRYEVLRSGLNDLIAVAAGLFCCYAVFFGNGWSLLWEFLKNVVLWLPQLL